MKKNILLFVLFVVLILIIGECGNRSKIATEQVDNSKIVKKQKDDLSWLVGT